MKVPPVIALLTFLFAQATITAAQSDEVVSRIKRTPVASTNVASVGYSRRLRALEIEFTRGAIYRFLKVQPDVYRDMMAAPSKGHFIAERLRGIYEFVRVRPRRSEEQPADRMAAQPK